MAEHCSETTGILQLPDEVIRQIISLLSARERLSIGNSCQRLHGLIFEDSGSVRCLDFSKKARLTTIEDILQYFDNENTSQHIRKIDARNVVSIKPGNQLNNSVGKASNLVDVNIHGTRFQNLSQFGSFLRPLRNLDRLTIDWPRTTKNDVNFCRRILSNGPFSRLSYLCVTLRMSAFTMFTSCLSMCQQLKELHMTGLGSYESNCINREINQLKNLKIVQYYGAKAIRMKEKFAAVVSDPKRWTDFQLCGAKPPEAFYIEKDVEVCQELLQSEEFQDMLKTAPLRSANLGWTLNPKILLREVLRIHFEDVPEEFCCLSTFVYRRRHLLKVEEAKMLLKNPNYQISYLYINHEFERGCDAHLIASAFPNLTELVVHAVTRSLEMPVKDSVLQRRLNRKDGTGPAEKNDLMKQDSSFRILVENTPHLKHFVLYLYWSDVERYDVDMLHQISGWQNLETLCLTDIPCEDGEFLVEIGKKCKNLKKLSLRSVCSRKAGSNKKALFEMFKYCRNLRDLTVGWSDIDQAQIFASLDDNSLSELERVNLIGTETKHLAAPWVSSFENLIGHCENLRTIICDSKFKTEDDYNQVVSAVERIKGEFQRGDFQIKLTCWIAKPKLRQMQDIGTAFEDLPPNEPLFVHWIGD